MKILAGELRETVFHTPDGDSRQNSPLTIKKETIYRPNEVAYIADDIGIHRVVNPNPNEVAISLHCMSIHTSYSLFLWWTFVIDKVCVVETR